MKKTGGHICDYCSTFFGQGLPEQSRIIYGKKRKLLVCSDECMDKRKKSLNPREGNINEY